jgi:glycosyltransferase involved in cell wall biosynthesis
LNVCYVAPDVAIPYYRGSSTHVYEISKNLAAMGHRVYVVSRRLRRSDSRWDFIDGFTIYRTYQGLVGEPPLTSFHSDHVDSGSRGLATRLYGFYLGSFRAFQLGAEIAAIMRGRKIEVVLERETALGAGAISSELMGVPLVLEVIGGRYSELSLKRATSIMTYSRKMVTGKAAAGRLEVVSTAVDTDLFSPDTIRGAETKRRYLSTGEPVVGYVGTFPRWHGVEVLLAACKDQLQKGRRLKIFLVGPYFEAAKAEATRLGLDDDVIFTGPVPYKDVPNYINACDVLCAPYYPAASSYRTKVGLGAPLKVMEYMACMKPVISTRSSPIPEILEDQKEGLLVEPGSVGELSLALATLLGNSALADGYARAARQRALQEFSWSQLAKRISKILANSAKQEGSKEAD